MSTQSKAWLFNFVDWAIKAVIVAIFGLLYRMDKKIDDHQAQINNIQSELTIIRSQMVAWDTLKRIEGQLYAFAAVGKGNEVMGMVAGMLRIEREAREKK